MASDISQQTQILVAEMAKLNKNIIFIWEIMYQHVKTIPVKSWAPEVMLWAQFGEFFML